MQQLLHHAFAFRKIMPKQIADRLTRREREIMNAIFELANRASVEAIRTRMTGPPQYLTVRVILTRLEKKGYVKHQYDGVRYIHSATISPAAAKKNGTAAVSPHVFRRFNDPDDDRACQRGLM